MNLHATKYEKINIKIHGITGSIVMGFVIGASKKYPQRVVSTAIKVFARNIKESAIPSTKANLAEFFNISKKLWRADGQNDSLVMAQ